MTDSEWFLYIVRCADGALYTGIATDVARRFAEHQSGSRRSAKYLKGKGPLSLVFAAVAGNRSEASSIENRLKRKSKAEKELLIEGIISLAELLAE